MVENNKNNIENEIEFQRCYNANSDALFRFFLYKVSDRNIALELFQEDFFKLWRAYTIGQKIDSCKSWLFKVGSNSVIDWYRRKKNLSLDVMLEAKTDFLISEDPIYANAEQSQAIKLFNKLPLKDKQLLTLRFVDNISNEVIAKTFSILPISVPVKIHRALKRLRILMNISESK